MPIQYNWQKLSPHDFAQLQELTSTSPRRLKEVLRELEDGGSLAQLRPLEPTNFDGFRKFLAAYLGPEVPDAVCKHLFLSFVLKADENDGDTLLPCDTSSCNSRTATLAKTSGTRRIAVDSSVSSVTATASRIWHRIASLSNPALHALAVNNGASPPLRSPSPSVFTRAVQRDPSDRMHKYASMGAGSRSGSGFGTGGDATTTPPHSRSFHNLQALRVSANNAVSSSKHRERTRSNPNVARVERNTQDGNGTPCACVDCAFKVFPSQLAGASQQAAAAAAVSCASSGASGSGSLSFARWWRMRERDKEKQQRASALSAAHYTELLKQELDELEHGRIYLKDLICYLSLLEAGTPDEKLEFCFRLYDADSNGLLDSKEIECIINQMMAVAEYLGWDVSELRPILESMMSEIDLDSDGNVSLDEWVRGGLTTVPLLVLLGIDENIRDDGAHVWRLKHFQRQAFCNVCRTALGGIRKQGLCCTFCKYSVHQRCAQTAAQNCIRTYTKSRRELSGPMAHHWIEGNYRGKCDRCGKSMRPANHTPPALRCRWCQLTVHDKCKAGVKDACDFGRLRELILPPTAVLPGVLERRGAPQPKRGDMLAGTLGAGVSQQSLVSSVANSSATTPTGGAQPTTTVAASGHALAERLASGAGGASSLQIQLEHTGPGGHRPLFVFVNPKSGGRQGARILRKLQCLMNPRQVFDMTRSGEPLAGLQFFRDVSGCRVLCAGGDGTVGWLLDAMDRTEWTAARPPVAVLPLGTGNDLARCLRWGGGYRDGDSLTKLLDRVRFAECVLLDRWQLDLLEAPVTKEERERERERARDRERERERDSERVPRASSFADNETENETANENERTSGVHSVSELCERERDRPTESTTSASASAYERELQSDPIPSTIINNYFSIGLDASIAHRFHTMRERHPERFKSRTRNKMFYFEFATSEAFQGTCRNLHHFVDVECDGVPLDLAHGPPLEAITLVNIPSIYGGSNLWGTSNAVSTSHRHGHNTALNVHFAQQDVGDRLIEVVGIESIFHTAQLKAGLRSSGRRLAQCHQVTIRTRKRFPMQIDGEPWMQTPCFIQIRHKNQVPVLAAPKSERKFGGLLGWFNKKRSARGANASATGIASDEPTNSASSSSASNSVDG